MSTPFLHSSIDGDRRVKQLISEMADRASGIPADVWAKVGDVVAGHMAEQFATEGAHLTGATWAPLSPKYLAWKIRRNLHRERLRATDQMRRSLTSRPMAVEEYTPSSGRWGTDDEKAGWHQTGTRHMPARVIIDVNRNPDLADDMNSVLARYIFEGRL